jgi:hypothetical protein
MMDYYTLFWVLVSFLIGYLFRDWMEYYSKTYKECDKCNGKGYVKETKKNT